MGIMERFTKKPGAAKDATAKEKKVVTKKTTTVKAEKKAADAVVATETEVVAKATNEVLISPVVTEKAAHAQTANNKYTFIVAAWAKKGQIKQAIKAVYGVDAAAVNVVNVEGHRIRFGKNTGKQSDFKKAIVTLPAGKTITIHEGV